MRARPFACQGVNGAPHRPEPLHRAPYRGFTDGLRAVEDPITWNGKNRRSSPKCAEKLNKLMSLETYL